MKKGFIVAFLILCLCVHASAFTKTGIVPADSWEKVMGAWKHDVVATQQIYKDRWVYGAVVWCVKGTIVRYAYTSGEETPEIALKKAQYGLESVPGECTEDSDYAVVRGDVF
jgi:hypothetical protein